MQNLSETACLSQHGLSPRWSSRSEFLPHDDVWNLTRFDVCFTDSDPHKICDGNPSVASCARGFARTVVEPQPNRLRRCAEFCEVCKQRQPVYRTSETWKIVRQADSCRCDKQHRYRCKFSTLECRRPRGKT